MILHIFHKLCIWYIFNNFILYFLSSQLWKDVSRWNHENLLCPWMDHWQYSTLKLFEKWLLSPVYAIVLQYMKIINFIWNQLWLAKNRQLMILVYLWSHYTGKIFSVFQELSNTNTNLIPTLKSICDESWWTKKAKSSSNLQDWPSTSMLMLRMDGWRNKLLWTIHQKDIFHSDAVCIRISKRGLHGYSICSISISGTLYFLRNTKKLFMICRRFDTVAINGWPKNRDLCFFVFQCLLHSINHIFICMNTVETWKLEPVPPMHCTFRN